MSLIVVCAFFNPYESLRRVQAFGRFRTNLERCGIRVLCVEQLFPGVTRVSGPTDIAVMGGALLWQKECLLQIGIDRAIGEGYDKIMICDADILFETPSALELVEASFSMYDYFQPFETITMEYSDGDVIRQSAMSVDFPRPYGSGHPGSCWAASGHFFQKIRLYTYAILGGGDVVMTHLGSSAVEHGATSDRFLDLCVYFTNCVLYPNLAPSLLEWARQFNDSSFRIGHTSGVNIRSLDHGSLARRSYHQRYEPWRGGRAITAPWPMRDFGLNQLGLLDWKSQREEWAQYVKGYFGMRDKEEVYL
jgi:hypothetical protein